MKNSLIYKLYKRVNAKCKEKTGSTLLMVVMTMSVLIIIGSSFMVLSQNSALDGIFASSQVKAEQTALSVANVIKQNMGDIIEERLFEIQNNGTNSTTFDVDSPNLFGNCKVTLSGDSYSANGNVPNTVTIKIEATVGRSTETLVFTAQLTTNDTYNMINAVTNSAVANGGSVNYSFPSGGIDGDVSLSGDYLLALYKGDEARGEVTVTGNVYCNGSLVLGARVLVGSDSTSSRSYNSLSTEITKNVYVNGDLIINSCDILGDVYVSGNILFNGLNNYNAYIGGNIYCGGNMYVTGTPFERYMTTDNKVGNNDTGFKLVYSENNDGAFPVFPTEAEIKEQSSLYQSYNSLIKSVTVSGSGTSAYIEVTRSDGSKDTFSTNPYSTMKVSGYDLDLNDGKDNDDRIWWQGTSDGWSLDGVMIIKNERAANKKGLIGAQNVDYSWRTYDSLSSVADSNARINELLCKYIIEHIAPYCAQSEFEKCIAYDNYTNLKVAGNIYVQNNAYIEANNTLATYNGKMFYTGGDFEFASGQIAKSIYGGNYNNAVTDFTATNLYAGNATKLGNLTAYDLGNNVSFWTYVVAEAAQDSWTNGKYSGGKEMKKGYYYLKNNLTSGSTFDQNMYYFGSNNLDEIRKAYKGDKVKTLTFKRFGVNVMVKKADTKIVCNAANSYNLSGAGVTDTVQGMYTSYLLNQNQSNNAWERKGIVSGTANINPTTVKQIFQEMGVYGYNAEEVYNRDYMNRSDPEADYELTGNKANDLHGVNFTGIAINQIKFASTLEQALNCDVIVHNKYELYDRLICLEYLAHLSGGTVAGNTWNDANMYKATEWLRAQWAAGNYTQFIGIKYNYESDHWRYLIMKDVYFDETPANITYEFNDYNHYEAYECHCGCHVLNDNEYRYWSTLTKGLVFGNNSLGSRRYEHMQIDTTYGDVRIYIRPTNTIKYNQNSYTAQNAMAIQYSVFETKDYKVKNGMANADTGVAYMIFIPTFYKWTGAQWQELDSPELLASHVDDMVSAKQSATDSSIYVGASGTQYRYASTEAERLKLYLTNYTAAIQDQEHAGFFCQDNSVMFIMCEGPMQIWCGLATNLQGVVYTPHKDSVVYLGNSLAEMTGGTSNDSMSGGSIVTGNIVMDYSVNEGPWANNTIYRPLHPDDMTADEYKNYLADKLLQGLGQIQTEADSSSSTTREWHFSAFK